MGIELKLEGEELFSAQLELLIKILATQQATISLLCDKHSSTTEKSDELFKDVQDEASGFAYSILRSLYERRGKIDLNDVLGDR